MFLKLSLFSLCKKITLLSFEFVNHDLQMLLWDSLVTIREQYNYLYYIKMKKHVNNLSSRYESMKRQRHRHMMKAWPSHMMTHCDHDVTHTHTHTCRLCPLNTQKTLGFCVLMHPSQTFIWACEVLNHTLQCQCVRVELGTHGFMLKRSRTAMFALCSRLRLRSVKNFSLVQVMWTRSGAASALSFNAAWDAVFLSWISWA